MNTLTARQMVRMVDRLTRRLELIEEEARIRDRGDQSHFTREFRRIRGVTPGAFRDLAATSRGGSFPVRLSSMESIPSAGTDPPPEGAESGDRRSDRS